MLMGKELEKISCAPAGTVFGIGGIEDIILKTATVTTNPACPTFLPMTFGVCLLEDAHIHSYTVGQLTSLVLVQSDRQSGC